MANFDVTICGARYVCRVITAIDILGKKTLFRYTGVHLMHYLVKYQWLLAKGP